MGRATQGVRLINLAKKNDIIASVCKVMSSELEATVEEQSRSNFSETTNKIENALMSNNETEEPEDIEEVNDADIADEQDNTAPEAYGDLFSQHLDDDK